MFNDYNEAPLISYEFGQDRVNKKEENASKWSYSHEAGVHPAQIHPDNRQPEFWSGKANFVGLSNVVKCSCTGCYPSSENQSYQGDTTCHRPWLPRTVPVSLNGSCEPYKLPGYQWDGGSMNQGPCYPDASAAFVQENGGKHAFYRHYQESRLPEANQPGVITSLKNADFGKKQKEDTSLQNGVRQPVLCNPVYNLAKRTDGRNYCDPTDKYSNAASFSVDQHIPRLPVVEPYIKAVPSNLSQNRVPSTGYRSVKENPTQSYLDQVYGDARKICTEQDAVGDKRNENYPTAALSSGAHVDYSNFGRDLPEPEPQKLFLDNGRHSDYYSKKNFHNVINRSNQSLDGRKDCVISQIGQMSDQQYGVARSKYQEAGKPSCETFYPKNLDKTRLESRLLESSPCFQRNEDKNENVNVHPRLTRSAFIFNDPRFTERTQNSYPYQNNPAYRNYGRPEYPHQGFGAQHRYEFPAGPQRNDCNQYRGTSQQMQICEQFVPQQGNGFVCDSQYQQNSEKAAQFYGAKDMSSILMETLSSDCKKPTHLEPIRNEALNKNGTSKISPLRLLRKKKIINVPHEPSHAASTLDAPPGLDVRKFWSTWAEEEEENVTPTQMFVLDCQNIDPEQAKLLHLYENDPGRTVELESGSLVLKGSACSKESPEEVVPLEEITIPEEVLPVSPKNDNRAFCEKVQQEEKNIEACTPTVCPEPESKPAGVERIPTTTSLFKTKAIKSGSGNRRAKKSGTMDKWTEKKFDFLKRSEESKAAEILRHEEEKKKIFETRMSLQQSLKKMDRPEEKTSSGRYENEKMSESLSSFDDENSQSCSPFGGNGDMCNLPTSEYRRNKFLDYSDRKVMVNGERINETVLVEGESVVIVGEGDPLEADEVKKENIKPESPLPADFLFPALEGKLKDRSCAVEDILPKMSEINFQNPEMKLQNATKDMVEKKLRTPTKKVKKKKSSDHQAENDQRSEKLMLETVKFSIQKSHDLKISLKVLNNSKKCPDEEPGSNHAEAQGNLVEDSQNSTELITLRYKSIQMDGDRRPTSESKKSRRRFRRKKDFPDAKTPVLKIRKNRYSSQFESDPLATHEDDDNFDLDNGCHDSKKPYSDVYSTSDDFRVHETVDSAKIKLTFKRHKNSIEKQYKINSNDLGQMLEQDPACDESESHTKTVRKTCRKKYRRAKGEEIFAEAGVESFRSPEVICDVYSSAESMTKEGEFVSGFDEDGKNSETSEDSYSKEENCLSEPAATGMPSDSRIELTTLEDEMYDNEELGLESCNDNLRSGEEREKSEGIEDSCKRDEDQVEVIMDEVIIGNKAKGLSLSEYSDEKWKDSTCGEAAWVEGGREGETEEERRDSERVGIGEISLDFISCTNSRGIEINEEAGKAEKADTGEEENNVDTTEENVGPETEFIHSEIESNFYQSKRADEKSHKNRVECGVSESLCEWKETSASDSDAAEIGSIRLQDLDSPADPLGNARLSPLPLDEAEDLVQNSRISKNSGRGMCDEDSNDVLPGTDKSIEADPVERAKMTEGSNCRSVGEEYVNFELPSNIVKDGNPVEDLVKSGLGRGSPPVDVESCSGDTARDAAAVDKREARDNDCEKKSNKQEVEIAKDDQSALNSSEEILENVNFECDKSGIVDLETVAEEEKHSTKVSRAEDCFHFENDSHISSQSQNGSYADCPSPSAGDGVEVSEITLEDVRFRKSESPEPENHGWELKCGVKESVTEKADCSFSVDMKGTVKDPESQSCEKTAKNVADEAFETPPRGGENMAGGPAESQKDFTAISCSLQPSISCEDSAVLLEMTDGQSEDHPRDLVSVHLPLTPEVELEDGEIEDSSSDESEVRSSGKEQRPDEMQAPDVNKLLSRQVAFMARRIERRNSAEPKLWFQRIESEMSTWSKRRFSKAKSCPREVKLTGGQCKKLKTKNKIEEIPLPLGPPPQYSCFDLKQCIGLTRRESLVVEAKKKPEESIQSEPMQVKVKEECRSELSTGESPKEVASLGTIDSQNGRNPGDGNSSLQLDIFQRSSKIKFSFSRQSRFSKTILKKPKERSPEILNQSDSRKEPEKNDFSPDPEGNKKDTISETPLVEQSLTAAECQSERVPNADPANGTELANDGKEESKEEEKKDLEQPAVLLAEDLGENIKVIDTVSDYMRDEFYEFEDIPTSEDLTNGDDMEIEKVNDDKFRNIMQNCLDNAKKFLNVGNLKLFSCSVDDLLDLDCPAPDPALEEQEAQPNHISRDVLLTSCEDTNDDLGLSENMQPSDLSMDFIPSLCSDVCPEILPVDNWPYLEEEVPSSPVKSKQDEADLIPNLETAYSNNALTSTDGHIQFHSKNGIDRRKRVIGESMFMRFRRRSLLSDGEAIRICSKIGGQRRNTVHGFSGMSCEKEIRDIKSELLRWTKGKNDTEKQSVKCRLSLEKLKSKHGINLKFKSEKMRISEDSMKRENGMRKKNGKRLDYKSASWQPKVMLFRISKNELRKLQRKSKSQNRPERIARREISSELESQDVPANKKPKPDCEVEKVLKLEHENGNVVDLGVRNEQKLVGMSGLESIKGSLSLMASTDERKRKKSRFRNLYTKKKLELDASKGDVVPAQKLPPADQALVDAEAVLAEMFRDCDRVPNPQVKSTKQVTNSTSGDKPKKKSTQIYSSADHNLSPEKPETKSTKTVDATRPYTDHQQHHRQREKSREKRSPRGDKRRDKGEHHRHKDRHKDGTRHSRREPSQRPERSKHSGRTLGRHTDEPARQSRDRSRSSSGGETKYKGQNEINPREPWQCEVCGFNDAEERASHIKNHPFHCQSCHLAFKTEAHFVSHLTKRHKNIRNQHHCLLCELSFDTEDQYMAHLETREHRHLESVEKNTINTLFTLLTGAPCPVLGLVEMKPEWLPNQAGTVHFYHQATPLSLALQYLKVHHDLKSFSAVSSAQPN